MGNVSYTSQQPTTIDNAGDNILLNGESKNEFRFTLEDVVRHPIVAELLERYKDDYELGALSAEETLSLWLKNQQYDENKFSNYFFKLRN